MMWGTYHTVAIGPFLFDFQPDLSANCVTVIAHYGSVMDIFSVHFVSRKLEPGWVAVIQKTDEPEYADMTRRWLADDNLPWSLAIQTGDSTMTFAEELLKRIAVFYVTKATGANLAPLLCRAPEFHARMVSMVEEKK